MVGFRCGFEEIGRVVFQCIHPRLQIGDVVLVELALQIGALDTEVCGKEKASKLRDQLFLSIGRASEAGVEFTGEGGRVSGRVGHLMQQDAGERFVRAEGLSRGDEDAVGSRRVGGAAEIAGALDDWASGRFFKVLGDDSRPVILVDGSVLRRDALDILRIEDVPVANELRVASGKLLLTGILVFLVEGELLPFLDERGLGTLFHVPTGILYLVEGSPPVVRIATHEPDEAKMHTVSALIHGAGDGVVRC